MTKKISIGLLTGYAFLILSETILIRTAGETASYNFEFLWSWRAWEIQKKQILTNVMMFVPIGLLAGAAWRWKGLFVAAGFSVVIEVLQLILHRGLCEFDDIFHNIIGAIIGILIVMVSKTIYQVISQNSK